MGTNKKQTAVDWLLDQMFNKNKLKYERGIQWVMPELVEQAKQMEREQIEEDYLQGMYAKHDIRGQLKASKYYEENYGN